MRLLNTYTGQFVEIVEGLGEIGYAILSHTWDKNGEQTYQEVREIQILYEGSGILKALQNPKQILPGPLARNGVASIRHPLDAVHPVGPIWDDPKLSSKIRRAAEIARKDGYELIWIDSCCIDKTSSSELSEAINSMYKWYGHAKMCYAYFEDVSVATKQGLRAESSEFRNSRWFTRGWTLQELISPLSVTFLSKDWKEIGTKHTLVALLEEITRIPEEALLHFTSLDRFSVAQRFSWAAERNTKRVEDKAYCLLGIFDINMPTLYGEGTRAFRRLQEEILRRVPDQSLYAWKSTTREAYERESRAHELERQVERCQLEVETSLRKLNIGTNNSGPRAAHKDCRICQLRISRLMDVHHTLRESRQMLNELLLKLSGPEHTSEPAYKRAIELSKRTTELDSQLNLMCEYLTNIPEDQSMPISGSFFASSPSNFSFIWGGNNIRAGSHVELSVILNHQLPPPEYTFTPHGIRTVFPVIPLSLCVPNITKIYSDVPEAQCYLVILDCKHAAFPDKVIGRVCYIPPSDSGIEYLHCNSVRTADAGAGGEPETLFFLSPHTINSCRGQIKVKELYIPHPEHGSGEREDARHQFHKKLLLMLPGKTRKALKEQGYAVYPDPDVEFPTTYSLTKQTDHTITIDYSYSFERGENARAQTLIIVANVQIAQENASGVSQISSSVTWTDPRSSWNAWQQTLPTQEVDFTIAGQQYKVLLGMKYAPHSHYAIDLGVVKA